MRAAVVRKKSLITNQYAQLHLEGTMYIRKSFWLGIDGNMTNTFELKMYPKLKCVRLMMYLFFQRFQHWLDGDDLINSLAQGLGLSPDTLNDRT